MTPRDAMAGSAPRTLTFTAAALTASRVGTWEYDAARDRLRCDAVMAELYGLSAAEGAAGVDRGRIYAAIHAADRPRAHAKDARVHARGGVYVIEYRVCPAPGEVSWVLVRGAFEAGAAPVGRGIVVDVTDGKQDGYLEGSALLLPPADADPAPLAGVTDRAVAIRAAVAALGDRDAAELRPLVDALLFGVGRRIAARLSASDVDDEPGNGILN